MAKSLLKASIRKKAPVARRTKLQDEKYTGVEPNWTGYEKLREEQQRSLQHCAFSYYNYHYTPSDLRKNIVAYGQANWAWGKEDIRAFNECEDGRVGMSLCSWATMKLQGFPEAETTFVKHKVAELLAYGAARLAEKDAKDGKPVVKRTVHDHMNEKFQDIVGEIEAWLDAASEGAEYPADMVAWMREQNVPQAFVNRIGAYYTPVMEELDAAKTKGTDPELKAAYKHYDKTRTKRVADFFAKLTDALTTYGSVKKATRAARVKKPVSKEKVVRKVKYATEATDLNLVSINPVDVIGAKELWVYNKKTRKLGKYVAAADSGTLGIKGTAILGFDDRLSISKTVRKPEIVMKKFMSAGKVQLRTWMDEINATPVKLNGRLNADTLLLKAAR
jgi:hypothetical protein